MKKVLFLVVACVLTLGMASCGPKKQVNKGEEEIAMSRTQQKAFEKPASRAWGTATQHELGFATRQAAATARQELAARLKTIITSKMDIYNYAPELFATDGNRSGSKKDADSKTEETVQAIVAAVPVMGAVIIDQSQFRTKDNQFRVEVCVEYNGGVAKMAQDAAEGYRRYIGQQVSAEKRQEIDKRATRFKAELEAQLRDMGE